MIDTMAKTVLANSLDAERRHSQAKRGEINKLANIGTASRNLIQIRYLRWREEMVDALRLHETHLQRTLRTNIQALAWAQPEKSPAVSRGSKMVHGAPIVCGGGIDVVDATRATGS